MATPEPVHEEDGVWYFWDETWADRYGPYKSEQEAIAKLDEYCEKVLGRKIEHD